MNQVKSAFLFLALFSFIVLNGCWESTPGATQQKSSSTQVTKTSNSNEEKIQTTLQVSDKIHIDQIGYRSKDKKIAVINRKNCKFQVVDEKDQSIVLSSDTAGTVNDVSSGDTVCYADFTSVEKPGSYYIAVQELGKSYPFKISDSVYKDVKNSLLKALYFQRCGMGLDKEYAGQWNHNPCHAGDGYIYGSEDKKLDGKGGWHDAGDYGKYSVPAAKAVADLMLAYEMFPKAFNDDVNIPESGNSIPDVLDECKYELNWFFKMQDKDTGGVYHKLTSKGFPGLTTLPEGDIDDLYFMPVSSPATGDFAAAMAMAARVYKPLDENFADRCLAAAEKAWSWLLKHKEMEFKNPEDVITGDYSDTNDKDERYWAAVELYKTTRKKEYHEYIKTIYKNPGFNKFYLKWTDTLETYDVGAFGTIEYLLMDKSQVDESLYNDMKNGFLAKADEFLNTSKSDGYHISLKPDEYWWSSNMNVMQRAFQLIVANLIRPNDEYIKYSQEHLHYLFGCNSLNQCFVTGFGSKSVKHPHLRLFIANGAGGPPPGFVAGGPDSSLEDPSTAHLKGLPPAKCYSDDEGSFSSNEITIYWNSSAELVAAYFVNEESIK